VLLKDELHNVENVAVANGLSKEAKCEILRIQKKV